MEKKCKVWNAFLEDYNDDELQRRYDNFVKNSNNQRKVYNDIVPLLNAKIDEFNSIESNIFNLALMRIHSEELLARRSVLNEEIKKLREDLFEIDRVIDTESELAKSYEKTSEHRLFVWYKALKSVSHPEVKNYTDFKKKWGKRII